MILVEQFDGSADPVELDPKKMTIEELEYYALTVLDPECAAELWKRQERGKRHLPGKHNQKLHGHGGGWTVGGPDEVSKYLTERSFTRLREAAPSSFSDAELHDLAGAAGAAVHEDAFILKDGNNTVYYTGKIGQRGSNFQKLSHDEQVKEATEMGEQLKALRSRNPVGDGEVAIELSEELHAQTALAGGRPIYGLTTPDSRVIGINPSLVTDGVSANFMPSSTNHKRYVLAHEYGHIHQETSGNTRDVLGRTELHTSGTRVEQSVETMRSSGALKSMSPYGLSDNDLFETYAEGFAEWSTTGGKTTNPAAKQMASDLGWR